MTATAPFTTCAHWCQTETEMRIETKICETCKHPLSAWAGGWVADIFFTIWLNPYIGVRHWINQQVFGSVFDELNLYVKFDQGTWLILTSPQLNAGYAWDWGQPILDNDQMQICAKDFSSIERKKEASMIWGNSVWTKFRQRNRCLSNLTLQGVASVNSIGFFFFFNATGSFRHL